MREKIGSCGTWSNIVVALARVEDIPGRLLSLANYPVNNGHAIVEFWIDGKWRLYDPTYEVYYVRGNPNVASPDILSFQELRNGEGMKSNVTRQIHNLKRFQIGGAWATAYTSLEIYSKADPAGPIDPNFPFVYPLTLSAKQKVISQDQFTAAYQGISYLGAAGICSFHRWTLTDLVPGKKYVFSILPGAIQGEQSQEPFTLQVNAEKGCRLPGGAFEIRVDKSNVGARIEIPFTATSKHATLLLSHPYRGPKFHYITVQEVRLIPIWSANAFRDKTRFRRRIVFPAVPRR